MKNPLRSKRLGPVVLGIWLIATGLMPLLHISFLHSGTLLSALAVAAGVLMLLDR